MRIPKEKLKKLRERLKGTDYGKAGELELQMPKQYIYDVANGKRKADPKVIAWLSNYALRKQPESESMTQLLERAIA